MAQDEKQETEEADEQENSFCPISSCDSQESSPIPFEYIILPVVTQEISSSTFDMEYFHYTLLTTYSYIFSFFN